MRSKFIAQEIGVLCLLANPLNGGVNNHDCCSQGNGIRDEMADAT